MPIWGNMDSDENIFYRKNSKALNYIKENIAKVEQKARNYNLNLLNSLPFSGDSPEVISRSKVEDTKRLLCQMPWKRMVINPAGYVCPACHCKKMVGNVSEDTLDNIWNNEGMQEYRKKIVNGDFSDLCNSHCVKGIISEELRGLK
jgi:MoaA/NifB/PqqE/SkfB family radical SAM enzyme